MDLLKTSKAMILLTWLCAIQTTKEYKRENTKVSMQPQRVAWETKYLSITNWRMVIWLNRVWQVKEWVIRVCTLMTQLLTTHLLCNLCNNLLSSTKRKINLIWDKENLSLKIEGHRAWILIWINLYWLLKNLLSIGKVNWRPF